MFMLDAQAYLDALKIFQLNMYEACEKAYRKASRIWSSSGLIVAHLKITILSIDYAVMERIKNLTVIPYLGDWSDVGAWDTVTTREPRRSWKRDPRRWFTLGEYKNIDSFRILISGGIGLDNLVVIETRDAVLTLTRPKRNRLKILWKF